jgi:hypothetical protein
LQDGHLVSRAADFIMYSVEAEFIDKVVAQYGPCQSTNVSLHLQIELTQLNESYENGCNRFGTDFGQGA